MLIEDRLPLDLVHGPGRLSDLLQHPAELAAVIGRDGALAEVDLRRLAFLDTETTGLAGGAGTFAFLVGVGRFEPNEGLFTLKQYFLRDPAEEKAMLAALLEDLEASQGLVTFNGRQFDLPLLDSRLIMNFRRRPALSARPHLDLLPPARRLWRGRLESCSLGSLEAHALGIQRTEEDVPGAWIPGMYLEYLRTGDPRDMLRVIYHNAVDIVTMVSLASHLMETYSRPPARARSPSESLALSRWRELEGQKEAAETGYLQALAGRLSDQERLRALARLSALLKRTRRRSQALSLWEEWASLDPADPEPAVELAIYYEWEARDLERASEWTATALVALTYWEKGWRLEYAREALERRMGRLKRKLSSRGQRDSD